MVINTRTPVVSTTTSVSTCRTEGEQGVRHGAVQARRAATHHRAPRAPVSAHQKGAHAAGIHRALLSPPKAIWATSNPQRARGEGLGPAPGQEWKALHERIQKHGAAFSQT